jgi:hypothetical protein
MGKIARLIVLSVLVNGTSSSLAGPSLEPSLLGGETFSEVYTAISDLEDGTYALLQLLFTNAGLGDGKAICRAMLVENGKLGINGFVALDRDDWSYDSGVDALNVGPCRLQRTQSGIDFIAVTEELELQFRFEGHPDSFRPPHSRVTEGESFHHTDIYLPWSSVDVAWKLPAEERKVASGMGYLDHVRSNLIVREVAKHWIRFRGYSGSTPILLQVRVPPQGPAKGWIWRHGEHKAKAIKPEDVRIDFTAAGVTVVLLEANAGLTLRTGEVLFRYRPLEGHPFGLLVKPIVGNPETVTYRASARHASGSTVVGTLEVSQFE